MDAEWPDGAPRVGELIAGKYVVERIIGRGGMGVVLAARHAELGQRVAIKLLRVDAPHGADVTARFLREARTCAQMQSEHVVRVFDVGRLQNGEPFLVMEYLAGTDLGGFVAAGGRAPVGDVTSWVLQACEAVAEAHSLGVIHRDLKPSNIFLATRADGSPIVKVLDFGISKLVSPDASDAALTTTGAMLGSPLFMSPEQIRASRDVDLRTDIWSLGVVLYQLLSGRCPFDGPTPTAVGVAIATETPLSVRSHRPDLPSGLDAVVMKCLEKSPDHRFQTVGELGRALATFAPPDAAPLVERIARLSRRNKLADTARSDAGPAGEGRGRLLLVDDDADLRRAFATQLRRLGWAVDEAAEGHEAIARLDAGRFDAIVSDIDMPGLGGVELLRAVRARADRTPVVLMTGGPSVPSAIAAVELGAFRYLVKPLGASALDEVLRVATSMTKRSVGAIGPNANAGMASRAALLHGMRGAFGASGDVTLLELVQLLSSTRKTGALMIVGETKREIHFSQGDVVDARCEVREGEDAFFALLRVAGGAFRFDPTFEPAKRAIGRTPEALLLEAMRRLDEGSHE